MVVHNGWEAVTVRKAAERSKASTSVIYGQFPGEEDRLRCLKQRGFQELADQRQHVREIRASSEKKLKTVCGV